MTYETIAKKELLYCWLQNYFKVLVPKKRGDGFLKVPYGHHNNEELNDISAELGCDDVFGIFGELTFQCKEKIFNGGDVAREQFESIAIPLLELHYGIPAIKIDESEFYRLHPIHRFQEVNE